MKQREELSQGQERWKSVGVVECGLGGTRGEAGERGRVQTLEDLEICAKKIGMLF